MHATFFSENSKLAFRRKGTASHLIVTRLVHSHKKWFQVVLKAGIYLITIVVRTAKGWCEMPQIQYYSLVLYISRNIYLSIGP